MVKAIAKMTANAGGIAEAAATAGALAPPVMVVSVPVLMVLVPRRRRARRADAMA